MSIMSFNTLNMTLMGWHPNPKSHILLHAGDIFTVEVQTSWPISSFDKPHEIPIKSNRHNHQQSFDGKPSCEVEIFTAD